MLLLPIEPAVIEDKFRGVDRRLESHFEPTAPVGRYDAILEEGVCKLLHGTRVRENRLIAIQEFQLLSGLKLDSLIDLIHQAEVENQEMSPLFRLFFAQVGHRAHSMNLHIQSLAV